MPRPPYDSQTFAEIVELARALAAGFSRREHARLQALAARCYGLAAGDFSHVLSTFPLVDEAERADAMDEFTKG